MLERGLGVRSLLRFTHSRRRSLSQVVVKTLSENKAFQQFALRTAKKTGSVVNKATSQAEKIKGSEVRVLSRPGGRSLPRKRGGQGDPALGCTGVPAASRRAQAVVKQERSPSLCALCVCAVCRRPRRRWRTPKRGCEEWLTG